MLQKVSIKDPGDTATFLVGEQIHINETLIDLLIKN